VPETTIDRDSSKAEDQFEALIRAAFPPNPKAPRRKFSGRPSGLSVKKQAKVSRLLYANRPCAMHELCASTPGAALKAARRVIALYQLADRCDLTARGVDTLHQRMVATAAVLDCMSELPIGKNTPQDWYDKKIARAEKLRNRIMYLTGARAEELELAIRRVNLAPSITVLAKS
jgi:hypothetical protein